MIIRISLLILFLSAISATEMKLKAQPVKTVINPTLMEHLFLNNQARTQSLNHFYKSYEKQSEWYGLSEKKMTQVLLIHEQVYQALSNVNSLFYNAKQIEYLREDLKNCRERLFEMIKLSAEKPQYAVWINKYYAQAIKQFTGIVEVFEEALGGNSKQLLDTYDRQDLIDKVHFKVKMLNISALSIINAIEFAESRAYIYSIPVLGTYVEQDKDFIQDIIKKYNYHYKNRL